MLSKNIFSAGECLATASLISYVSASVQPLEMPRGPPPLHWQEGRCLGSALPHFFGKPGVNIKNYLGTLPPDPLLSTFNRPQDFYSFLQKYLKFSCGFHPQIPSYILPINIQQTQRFLLISAQIFKIFLGASPPDPLISHSNNI